MDQISATIFLRECSKYIVENSDFNVLLIIFAFALVKLYDYAEFPVGNVCFVSTYLKSKIID